MSENVDAVRKQRGRYDLALVRKERLSVESERHLAPGRNRENGMSGYAMLIGHFSIFIGYIMPRRNPPLQHDDAQEIRKDRQ